MFFMKVMTKRCSLLHDTLYDSAPPLGTNMETGEPVAIKFESCHARIPQLREEQTIYSMLENMRKV